MRYTARTLILEITIILLALVFLFPFYLVLINSVKSFGDVLSYTSQWPKVFVWTNYSRVWKIMSFPHAFVNSLLITVFANAGLILISAMAAYRMVRRQSTLNRILFTLFVAAMVIPFQSIMIPLMKVTSTLGLLNSIPGVIICYFGFGVSLTLFLFHGFVKTIPLEVEESGVVDGCSPYGLFWRIVLPLLRPITVTVLILNTLWIWNDFLLPFLILGKPGLRTIPLSTFSFFGQYTKQWDLALAGLVLGVTPIVIFFLALQRHIVEGITTGSVKG